MANRRVLRYALKVWIGRANELVSIVHGHTLVGVFSEAVTGNGREPRRSSFLLDKGLSKV